MPLPTLPLEVHGAIAGFLTDPGDLANLARVSRITQLGAERQLYHRVTLDPIRQKALCTTVIETTRFAKHIRVCEMHLAGSEPSTDYPIPDLDNPEYHELSRKLLSRLPQFRGLIELIVRGLMMGANVHLGDTLVKCEFSLIKFVSSCPLDQGTADFLLRSKSLTEVSVISSRFAGSSAEISTLESKRAQIISATEASEDTSLSGDPWPGGSKKMVLRTLILDNVPLLTHNRPVTHLEVIVWSGDIHMAKSHLTKSTVPLRSLLVTQGLKFRKNDLTILGGILPELRYLGECRFTEKLDVVQQQIRTMPKLNTLVMNYQSLLYLLGDGTTPDKETPGASIFQVDSPENRDRAENEVVERLGESNKALNTVIFTAALAPIAVWERSDKQWMKLPRESYNIMYCLDTWREA